MILMPKIFDNTANENARYKGNELESLFFGRFVMSHTHTHTTEGPTLCCVVSCQALQALTCNDEAFIYLIDEFKIA